MSFMVTLHKKREKSLVKHHPWVFASGIRSIKGKPGLGDTVDVYSAGGSWLARGAYSPHSQIAIRVWTFNQDQCVDDAFFLERLRQAIQLRQSLILSSTSNACRLVAAEADGLPGLIVDRYDTCLVCQFGAAGVDRHKSQIVAALRMLLPECKVYERSDLDARAKEGLEKVSGPLSEHDFPETLQIEENGLQLHVDYRAGHKTGFYLDQRQNRKIAGQYCENKTVLNCFCYSGAFNLTALQGGARFVTNIDASQSALDLAEKNARLNGANPDRYELVKGDVFQLLRLYQEEKRKFDTIILDPPKFVDSRAQLERASRGYKDINRLAMTLLNPGGVLLTFSCSGLMSSEHFSKIIAFAALDSGRDVKIVQRLSQDSDHPTLSAFPESFYLKGLVCYLA